MENELDNHDVNHMIWHKACRLEINHASGPKDLIQQDTEMTQVKCERQYEWGSAPGKFLDPCHVFDFFLACMVAIYSEFISLAVNKSNSKGYFAAQTRSNPKHLRY